MRLFLMSTWTCEQKSENPKSVVNQHNDKNTSHTSNYQFPLMIWNEPLFIFDLFSFTLFFPAFIWLCLVLEHCIIKLADFLFESFDRFLFLLSLFLDKSAFYISGELAASIANLRFWALWWLANLHLIVPSTRKAFKSICLFANSRLVLRLRDNWGISCLFLSGHTSNLY